MITTTVLWASRSSFTPFNPLLVRSWSELRRVLVRAFPVFVNTAVVGMAVLLLMGHSSFVPKWTVLFLLLAPVNLFFTCMSEEAFFRGFVQHQLSRIGSRRACWAFMRTQRIEAAMAVHLGVNAVFLLFTYPRLA